MDYSQYETDENGIITPAGVAAEIEDLSRQVTGLFLRIADGYNKVNRSIENDVTMIYALDDLQGLVGDLSDAVAGDRDNNREIVTRVFTEELGRE